jgi:cyclic beta-1,2-glucan synthetase
MKVTNNTVTDILLRTRSYFQGDESTRKYAYEAPLRAELYSSDQMELRGKAVAKSHKLLTGKAPDQLLKRLADNERILLEVRDLLAETIKTNRRVTPAGEWLLDNFYLIEEQIILAKKHFPKGYSRGLPRLSNGPSEGLPRVYDIALEIISHSDGRVDLNTLSSFVAAYQQVSKLAIGELWAIPIMLRLALIENLRRVSARIAMDKIDQNMANYWAELMMKTADEKPKDLILLIADMARSKPPLDSPFVAEMTRKLLGKGPALAMTLTWIEQQLSGSGITSNELVHFENQKQAADQVSVSNSIGSLKFLGATDWREFVETVSSIDGILSQDVNSTYSLMDFATRDGYRHVVERIAKNSDKTEQEVAQMAIDFAKENAELQGAQDRTAHVGYFLIDKGLDRLQQAAGMKYSLLALWQKFIRKYPYTFYLGNIFLITLLFGSGMAWAAWRSGLNAWWIATVFILGTLCISQLAIMVVNWLVTQLVAPELLPKMDFAKGIPSEARTLVVVPTMLTDKATLDELIEGLEVRFLANVDHHLHYALLTDFPDAASEHLPSDDSLLEQARTRISELNQQYRRMHSDIFFFFHRPRKWNPKEKVWMGYERKRGKLSELNQLLRGKGAGNFSVIMADESVFPNIRYIITLDTDTQLPRDAAWKFVATMAHPLNHAVYNEQKQRVVAGYGILQPRVAVTMPVAGSSRYVYMHANDTGLDPYTRVVSDVYQDLFGEGSFIGKGVYDIDVFEKTLHSKFPDNRILSHDLLEGNYARSGLLSDVLVYEENPSRYSADVKRRHRWIRGDWQVGGWMLPWVPKGNEKGLTRNTLSTLSRWKIFDNIRRSLVPLALTLLLVLGWTQLTHARFWILIVSMVFFLPVVINAGWQLLNKPLNVSVREHLNDTWKNLSAGVLGTLFDIAVLPYEAYYTLDAIVRTNWRMIVSKRKLLEWTPSSQSSRQSLSLASSFMTMWAGPLLAVVMTVVLLRHAPQYLLISLPFLLLWLASPAIAWWISEPIRKKTAVLSDEQQRFLYKLSRKTWSFFERFVGPDDNWLPPDNFQEHPDEKIAHRTSPTNIGLGLLANLTAFDFGYISVRKATENIRNTMTTLESMDTYKGHFYNWYDTITKGPLLPRYVSTVDSGNLAGHLLTLKQGLLGLIHQPVVNPRLFKGLRDTLSIITDLKSKSNADSLSTLEQLIDQYNNQTPITLTEVANALNSLEEAINGLLTTVAHHENDELSGWLTAFSDQVKDHLTELTILTPWHILAATPGSLPEQSLPDAIPTLYQLASMSGLPATLLVAETHTEEERIWLETVHESMVAASHNAIQRIKALERLAAQADGMADMDYDFLYDKSKNLLRIGFNVDELRKDASYYDLLASEARLGNFVAVAQGKLPQESWFSLGRLLTNTGGDPVLLSWSGSMFEYLMPLLVMPVYENTLLDQTHKASVKRQKEYGRQKNVPWGISEAGYNTVDAAMNYQYRAFGVPGLGLKRGLSDDLVIAPYASMMALMVTPEDACRNLQELAALGFEGKYGFYEAIDYTPQRLPRGQNFAVVRSFMVHHQGMGFLSLAYLLLDMPMQKRFEAEPQLQATLLLLQERSPKGNLFYTHNSDVTETHHETTIPEIRVIATPDTPTPEVQLLTNSKYQVAITNAGGGYSRWKDIAVTRWREDSIQDDWGVFCYIKELQHGEFWSNTFQPTLKRGNRYEAVFSQGQAEFHRSDNGFDTRTEIVVSPEDDIELRRVRITNRTQVQQVIEVTSYAEVVLAAQGADTSHPAFSNLFVQTELHEHLPAIICTRRARSSHETPPWMFHQVMVQGGIVEKVSYETDRMKFIGRGNTTANPQAMQVNGELSGSQGPVLDPIVAIRYRISLKPGQTAIVDMVIGVSETRDICYNLVEKYHDRHLKNRAFELSWTHSQVLLRQINATEADAQLYGRLASSIIYANPNLRADPFIIKSNHKGQSGLWSYAISGDLPIILLRVNDSENVELVQQMIQAHAYWRLKGLAVDLVIWNEDHGSYRQVLQDQILGMITAVSGGYMTDRPGGVYVRSADQISNEDRILFQTVARAIIYDNRGTLAEQINKKSVAKAMPPALKQASTHYRGHVQQPPVRNDLLFFNGIGGFSPDGKEYIITTTGDQKTPVPWVNVIANPDFGTVISESGTAYSWAENAHEFRLTPWNNDPVSDKGGEAFYIRDEEAGHFWSPAPLPARGQSYYTTRHGFGYSIFEHNEDEIYSEMKVFVDIEASVKFIVIKLKNLSGRQRSLSATGYIEWVMGDLRSKTQMHIVSEPDTATGAIFIRNRYNTTFSDRMAFFDTDDPSRTYTADRSEFIGRNGSLQNPASMHRTKLSGRSGSGLDPCTAMQVSFTLGEDEEKEIIFRLGTARKSRVIRELVQQFKGAAAAEASFKKVQEYWQNALSAVQVNTPDKALNVLANGWLPYQTLACRIWARSGYYQSGGAYGFRDQLQDVLSMIHSKPELARTQILRCASRQFKEGDVQHWWHPPLGRGVRTRCSDDFLWLPFATARYILGTNDLDILKQSVTYLEGRLLNAGEESYYDLPNQSEQAESLYEHCVAAIRHGFRWGVNGLPLIGSGDWNDGMDRVGIDDKGESVWLAFFFYDVLMRFSKVARLNNDDAFADECEREAATLQGNIEKNAWDGEWYRRAYFDDGTPLGAKDNDECRIDSISQSWSVLSGAGDPERARMGMQAVDKYLVRRDLGLIQLLDPPFDKSAMNPGYIKGYVPGVRENGGQYTHAAIWTIMAFAALGEHEKVWELFSLINPINHGNTPELINIYKAEPYVAAADIYAVAPHEGRGGWTWYTGSAGWMNYLILDSILGLKLEADRLRISPCIPAEWDSFTVHYRHRSSLYHITVIQPVISRGPTITRIDGQEVSSVYIDLLDDGAEHTVEVQLGINREPGV